MKPTLEDLLAGVPPQEGNGGQLLVPTVSAAKDARAEVLSQIDRTTANARDVLKAEADAHAEKKARLKAAREEQENSG